MADLKVIIVDWESLLHGGSLLLCRTGRRREQVFGVPHILQTFVFNIFDFLCNHPFLPFLESKWLLVTTDQFVCFSPNLSPLAVESHWHREQSEGEERWWSTRVLYQYALPTENQINESKSERNESVVPIRNNMWVRLKEMKVKVLYHSQLKVCVAVVDGHCYLP